MLQTSRIPNELEVLYW